MTYNPFIHLGQDPISFFGWLGYALVVLLFAGGGASWAIRKGSMCIAQALDRNRRQQKWWGEAYGGWFPDSTWQLRAASVLAALAVASWAIGSVVWFASGGAT